MDQSRWYNTNKSSRFWKHVGRLVASILVVSALSLLNSTSIFAAGFLSSVESPGNITQEQTGNVQTVQNAVGVNTISGMVSLPTGVAPAGGMSVDIYASNLAGSGSGHVSVTIDPENASAIYSMEVPEDGGASWRIYYVCNSCVGYFTFGYYAESSTTPDFTQATLLPGGSDHSGKNMTLLVPNTIDGTVLLPGSDVAPAGGMYIDIYANNQNGSGSGYASVFLAAGGNSGDYSMEVPPDSGAGWLVRYNNYDGVYYFEGNYAESGTTPDSTQATLLPGGSDHSGKNLTLLVPNTIDGTVSLPGNDVAPAGGMNINISAINQNGSGSGFASAFIAAGEGSGDYSIVVSPDSGASWQVKYQYYGGDYYSTGYYAVSGTTWDSSQATLLPGGTDLIDKNLTLLIPITISGSVSLPGSDVLAGGLSINISASAPNGSGDSVAGTNVYISAGGSSEVYSLNVPQDSGVDWRISYNCYNCVNYNYTREGHYADSGTTWYPSQATLLPGGSDLSSIDMDILNGNSIEGIVSLPGSDVAPVGGLSIEISTNNQNLSDPAHATSQVYIQAGFPAATITYKLSVPEDATASWGIKYRGGDEYGYADIGYYADNDTVCHIDEATLLPGGSNYSDKDLTLINHCEEKRKKENMICLPVTGDNEKVSMVCFRNRRQ